MELPIQQLPIEQNSYLVSVLITILILLIGFIGTIFWKKLSKFEEKFEIMLDKIQTNSLNELANKKDIESLRTDIDDHEERLSDLERNKTSK